MHENPTAPTRHAPLEIAPETFVIQAAHGEGDAPQVVHMNSMLIRGAEPVVVDTGLATNRERYLEDLFGLVEPEDVRWVFVSHEDADHVGNLDAVMAACPRATLVASWFLCQRLAADGPAASPLRWRWVGDGETFAAGDRVLAAVRPPLYDSPATRGLFDPTTGVYWGSDAFATPVPAPMRWVSELDPLAWEAGFATFHQWNSPWASMVDDGAYGDAVERLRSLGIRTIASCHGPSIEAPLVPTALDHLRAVPRAAGVAPQPGQPVLDEIVAGILAASQPTAA